MNELQITGLTVKIPIKEDEKFKGRATIIFNNSFIVKNIKIIENGNKLFISMPSQRLRNGTFQDIVHPLNRETRKIIEEKILTKYFELINKRKIAKPDYLEEKKLIFIKQPTD